MSRKRIRNLTRQGLPGRLQFERLDALLEDLAGALLGVERWKTGKSAV